MRTSSLRWLALGSPRVVSVHDYVLRADATTVISNRVRSPDGDLTPGACPPGKCSPDGARAMHACGGVCLVPEPATFLDGARRAPCSSASGRCPTCHVRTLRDSRMMRRRVYQRTDVPTLGPVSRLDMRRWSTAAVLGALGAVLHPRPPSPKQNNKHTSTDAASTIFRTRPIQCKARVWPGPGTRTPARVAGSTPAHIRKGRRQAKEDLREKTASSSCQGEPGAV